MKRAVVVLLLLIANAIVSPSKINRAEDALRRRRWRKFPTCSLNRRASWRLAPLYDPRLFLYAVRMLVKTPALHDHRHPRDRARDWREHDQFLDRQRGSSPSVAADSEPGSAVYLDAVFHQDSRSGCPGCRLSGLSRVQETGDTRSKACGAWQERPSSSRMAKSPTVFSARTCRRRRFPFLGVQPIHRSRISSGGRQSERAAGRVARLPRLAESIRR